MKISNTDSRYGNAVAGTGLEFSLNSNWTGEVMLNGYTGDKSGVSGNLNLKYSF